MMIVEAVGDEAAAQVCRTLSQTRADLAAGPGHIRAEILIEDDGRMQVS
jgi:hypothetical protein